MIDKLINWTMTLCLRIFAKLMYLGKIRQGIQYNDKIGFAAMTASAVLRHLSKKESTANIIIPFRNDGRMEVIWTNNLGRDGTLAALKALVEGFEKPENQDPSLVENLK